jgi:hypothetical protein
MDQRPGARGNPTSRQYCGSWLLRSRARRKDKEEKKETFDE